MIMKLRKTDCQAVDLLLDGEPSSAVREGGPGYAASSGRLSQRVRVVEKLLQLLDTVPVEEPPKDLVTRTLQRLNGNGSPSGYVAVPDDSQPDDSRQSTL
jgi:hypothetical protein